MGSTRISASLFLPGLALAAAASWVALDVDDGLPVLVLHAAGPLAVGAGLSLGWRRWSSSRATASRDARAHRRFPFKRLLRRVRARRALDDLLDRLRFRIDTFPNGLYQPVRSLPRAGVTRSRGSESRWEAIAPVVREQAVESALDIGACEGYFAIELASAGIPVIAVENAPVNYRTMLLAVKRSHARNVGVLVLEVTPENVETLPAADCVLCLSIWHHFVRAHGLEQATAMLAAIWERSRKVMFFDTGETEMTPDYRLPAMSPEPRSWLAEYLAATCAGSRVEHLGTHAAFDPRGNPCERNLFAVVRTAR